MDVGADGEGVRWGPSYGTRLYGFDESGRPVRVDPRTRRTTAVDAFAGQSVARYRLTAAPGRLAVARGGITVDLRVTASGRPTSVVHPQVETATGADGVLNLLVTGMIEDAVGDVSEVAGFVRIDAAGRGLVEGVRPVSSDSDPADGARIGVRLGDSRPWLMVIGADAVRVYRRG